MFLLLLSLIFQFNTKFVFSSASFIPLLSPIFGVSKFCVSNNENKKKIVCW